MGFALMLFAALLAMSVIMITAVNYGIVKDGQVAPLKAENTFSERETGKAQTKLTIVDTCLSGYYPYNFHSGGTGPYTLWLKVRNNGSTVLKPQNTTVFFNLSYYSFSVNSGINSSAPFGEVWPPLKDLGIGIPDIHIPSLNYPYRLMISSGNGITAIAPTAPVNFSGMSIKSNTSYSFSWSPSIDDTGIAYYILSDASNKPGGDCPQGVNGTLRIPGNATSSAMSQEVACPQGCSNAYFFLTAVDTDGNMGMQSVTLKCTPANDKNCVNETIK